jgi:hypothetical protein
MRRTVLLLLPMFALLACGADRPLRGGYRAPVQRVQRQRVATPADTLATLKWAIARRDRAAEWRTLGPAFKMRLNREAGRNVDVGDYTQFRESQRNNPRIRKLEQYMPSARVTGVRHDGRGGAWVTIRFGGPLFFGASTQVKMIHHAIWVLWIRGESTPYWGFDGQKLSEATAGPDGSYTVTTRDPRGNVTWQQTFPREQVARYVTTTRWYFDNFGAMEREFINMR